MSFQKTEGFSLVELIIVLLVISILTLALTPAFKSYKIKANRSDGIKSLLALQIAQEKYRLNNTAYASSVAAAGLSTNSIDGYYTLAVSTSGASNYTLTATATGDQTNDTGCTTLTITYATNTTNKTPTNCWQ
ncbi:MAG: hypothetical protein COY58_04780 [Gammaproteobacteria bacterium CG_4_10_14_0_8_um_filter_38_16]|nr:MAG: hypothetical protein COY58_04780 [Gammaproteobacteria bacterium CG_4_10_14_0_8_um_filter_38_16]PJA03180.1 MAG: hypothetical protein COX72_06735 [Gammaproteobacteria bacterium CG_4_10_14_0_2_um_filter_38_22]PJB09970.1 MAG: hypothetical protein CO120_07335 [Gammaproteobacteria bacterium CG_4_9_14_3_um_filter_38_9]